MPITIITGRAGSGKSAKLYELINVLGVQNKEVLLIVPEQFTLQAERELIASNQNNGYLSVNVMSITRLALQIFTTLHAPHKKIIDSRVKAALMRQVSLSIQDELKVFSKAISFSGFATGLAELIGDLKKYDITPQDIHSATENITQNIEKLSDLSKLYEAFDTFLHDKDYMDADDKINFLIDLLPRAQQYTKTHFFIDGFDKFTQQDLRVFEALFMLSRNMTICVNAPVGTDESIFFSGKKAIEDIIQFAKKTDASYNIEKASSPHVKKHPSISHLEKNLYANYPQVYQGESAIAITAANDMLQEAEYTACNILSIIKQSKYTINFHDISILCCGSLNEYGPLLERIFARYNIPCFTHQRKAMSQHPAVSYLLSCISAIISHYNRNDILAILKSGYAGIDYEDAILFEDYIIDNAIDHYLFDRKLLRGAKKYDLKNINRIKDTLLAPLGVLTDAKLPASDHIKKIYEMMDIAKLKQSLTDEQESLLAQDLQKYAAQTAQAWNTMIEVLEQLYALFEGHIMSLEEVLFALEESFISTQIGILPVSSDEVLIGELGRTKLAKTKVLMVLGANEGSLPMLASENAILNDNDLDALYRQGIDIKKAPSTKRAANDYLIYQALTTPSDALHISYPLSGTTDTRLPSMICTQIEEMFAITTRSAHINSLISKAAALSTAATAFGAIGDGRMAPDGWEQAVSALIHHPEKSDALDTMKIFASPQQKVCDIAPKKDNVIISSVSQLEQYASCPFSYMVKYALRPAGDPEDDITPAGEGAFLHEAMERLGQKLSENDINTLNDNEIETIMEDEAQIIAQNFDNQRLSRDGKGIYQASSLIKTAKHGALVYADHLRKSTFIPQEQELAFGEGRALGPIDITLDSGTKVQITGKVDRLDTASTQQGSLARIVDYKSSIKKIDYSKILSGRQLQLFIYMDAYLDKNPGVQASGVFYFPVSHRFIDEDTQRYKQDQMQGLFVDDAENITALDENILQQGSSTLIKASLKKDGSFKQYQDNISKNGFKKVLHHSRNTAKDLLNNIDSGLIPVFPVKNKTESACTYCDYSAICRKDINMHDENIELDPAQAKERIIGGDDHE